jgi:hypothetical protein
LNQKQFLIIIAMKIQIFQVNLDTDTPEDEWS